jgi:hypothetical protein
MSTETPAQIAARYAAARAELEAERVATSLLFQKFETIQARYTTLTEDPTAVTPESLQSVLAELDAFRTEYNALLAVSRETTAKIAALPDVTFDSKTTLQGEDEQLSTQRNTTLNNTLIPFRDTVRAEAARVAREAAEKEQAETVDAPEDIVDYRAVQNTDGSGPGDIGTWYVEGENGEIDSSGLTQDAAGLRAAELNLEQQNTELPEGPPEDQPGANEYRAVFNDGTGPGTLGTWYVLGPGGQTSFSGKSEADARAEADRLNIEQAIGNQPAPGTPGTPGTLDPQQAAEAERAALTQQLREQAARSAQRKQANEGDWRVKLRLAESADYLYRDPDLREDGILWPLAVTNGVIFPYTPAITTSYNASYADQALTHSNYKGYFYQNSHVGDIGITATFTAQDTSEANYLLAVIHFFRSVTKMFYGQDAQRGAPPPLVFLQGLGEMQFNLHPCVVSSFQYNLPADVDYIRARTANITGSTDNLLFRRSLTSTTSSAGASNTRLESAGLSKGARTPFTPGLASPLGVGTATQGPTYVPTKMEVTLTLLPIQTRLQQSQEFSVRQFANGSLQKGGFW